MVIWWKKAQEGAGSGEARGQEGSTLGSRRSCAWGGGEGGDD